MYQWVDMVVHWYTKLLILDHYSQNQNILSLHMSQGVSWRSVERRWHVPPTCIYQISPSNVHVHVHGNNYVHYTHMYMYLFLPAFLDLFLLLDNDCLQLQEWTTAESSALAGLHTGFWVKGVVREGRCILRMYCKSCMSVHTCTSSSCWCSSCFCFLINAQIVTAALWSHIHIHVYVHVHLYIHIYVYIHVGVVLAFVYSIHINIHV